MQPTITSSVFARMTTRVRVDPDITEQQLSVALQGWLEHQPTRDLPKLLEDLGKEVTQSSSPSPYWMAKFADLAIKFITLAPNCKLPPRKTAMAVQIEHTRRT